MGFGSHGGLVVAVRSLLSGCWSVTALPIELAVIASEARQSSVVYRSSIQAGIACTRTDPVPTNNDRWPTKTEPGPQRIDPRRVRTPVSARFDPDFKTTNK